MKALRLRSNMPQIKSEFFDDFVKWANIGCEVVEVETAKLEPTQSDFNSDKIEFMMLRIYNLDPSFKGRITISKDGYILDGHHRWRAFYAVGSKYVECHVLSAGVEEAIKLMLAYPNSVCHTLNDERSK